MTSQFPAAIILPDSLAPVIALLSETLPKRQAQTLHRALVAAARAGRDLNTVTSRLMDWLLLTELPQQSIDAAERVNVSLRLVANARTQSAEMRDAAGDALWEAYQAAGANTCAINEAAGWALDASTGEDGSAAARSVQWALKLPSARKHIAGAIIDLLK